MKLMKTLILWLLLLALPLQGYAAVALNFCPTSANPPSSVSKQHCHTVNAAALHDAAASTLDANCADAVGDHKCSNCASCGMVAPFVPGSLPQSAFKPLGSERIAYVASYVTTHLPDGLERPPHSLAA